MRLLPLLILLACSEVTAPVVPFTVELSHEIVRVDDQGCHYYLHMEGVGEPGRWVVADHAQIELWTDERKAAWEVMGQEYFPTPRIHAGETRRSYRRAFVNPPESFEVRYRWWFVSDDGTGLSATHTVECAP